MGTGMQEKQQGNEDRHQRWGRLERAALLGQYGERQAQGLSQRQAAQGAGRAPQYAAGVARVPRPPRCLSRGCGVFPKCSRSRLLASVGHRTPCGVW